MKSLRLIALAAGLTFLSSWTSGAPIDNMVSDSLPEVTLNIQTKKLTYLVDNNFLSMSVDPEQLLRHSQPGPGALRLLSMASAMSPAYLRVAGPTTEFMGFEGSPAHTGDTITVNDHQWGQLQTLCSTAGLRAIVALSARRRPGGGSHWDSRDAMRILAAIDASSVAPAGWQLGYDWATLRKAGVSPSQAATDINTLKSLIQEFPTLAKEAQILLGPDVDPTNADAEAANEIAKGTNIGAVVVRPFTIDDPTGAKLDRDFINKVLGRNAKRPLWIAESGGICTAPFSAALLWAQRLCTATRLGAQVILRDLDLDAARDNATPDLWVSLLHKTLTSRGVLDARSNGPEAGELSISAHCTPSSKDHESPKARPVSPAIRYDLGAVTIMAANPSDRSLRLSLKMASNGISSLVGATDDVATMVHEYVLSAPNNDLNSTSTLLNGSPLEMAPGGGIPVLSPRQLQLDSSSMKVTLPSKSIAFWVVPGAKARACLASPASSDVAPAASRLRPISARGMEIGVHLDGDSILPAEPEPKEIQEEVENTHSSESGESSLVKDLRRRRPRISGRPAATPRLSLPRISSSPRRLDLGRAARDQEVKTLDDFIREELRSRPRLRASEPSRLPTLPSLNLPPLPTMVSLPIPTIRPLNVSSIELPQLPSIPTLGQLDSSTILDPLKVNSDLQKLNSEIQHSLVQQATTPLRSLVRMTDGFLDQIDRSPNADRAKRSADDPYCEDDGIDEYPEEMDDRLRFKRKSVFDYMKEDLTRKHKKTLPDHDVEQAMSQSEDLKRHRRDVPRFRRLAPDDMGLRFKRKPAVPDFLSLPRLPKRPLVTPPAAKRAQLLISQTNEEGTPNAWGSTHREMFPQGDVFAGTESPPNAKNPDVDYVSDDDYPAPQNSRAPGFRGNQPIPEKDALYYAPAEFYDPLVNQRRAPVKTLSTVGEFGEWEYLPGKVSPSFDDSAADSYKVVPAAKPNQEQEAEIQSKLRKRLEDHYADVQKAALDRKAEPDSEEDDVPEETMDMDSLRALAERYRQEKKLPLPEDVKGSSNGLEKQAEVKETEKSADPKSRRRRDVEGVLPPSDEHQTPLQKDESVEVVNSAVPHESKGLPIKKAVDLPSDSSHKMSDELRDRRMEKIKTFRDKITKANNDRPHVPLRGKLGHDSNEQTDSTRHRRDATPGEYYSPLEGSIDRVRKQISPEEEGYHPAPWESPRAALDYPQMSEPPYEERWPSEPQPRYSGSYGGMSGGNHRRPYGNHGFGSHPPGFGGENPHEYPTYPSAYPYKPEHRPGFGSSHGFGSYPSHSEESCESEESEFEHYPKPHHQNGHGLFGKSALDFDPEFDLPEDTVIEDFSMEERIKSGRAPQRVPNIVAIPWEVSRPSNVRFKRDVNPGMSNTIVQTKSTPEPSAEIAEAIRKLHKILNEDSSASSEETSVEVNYGGKLIDSPGTVDSLEDTIQDLLNMTRHLNDTLNQERHEMISWSEFGMDDAKPVEPQLDPEEMKFRDAAVAWIQAAKEGKVGKSPKESDDTDHHFSVKKQLPDGEDSSPAKELERQQKLTEQENIVTAMMQRVSALLSELRTIMKKKEAKSDNP